MSRVVADHVEREVRIPAGDATLAGNVTVPRAGHAPILFETQGVAIQDVAVAALAYQRYCESSSTINPREGIR